MHDVFISYEHQSKNIADNIVNVLESNRIRCWYAPRDVIGDYATSICDAIAVSKIFILILNERSSKSDHCLNEVEMAYMANMEHDNNIVIMPFKVDDKDLNRAMEYYVKRLHWIDATNRSLDFAISELLEKVASILGISLKSQAPEIKPSERTANKYDAITQSELNRLKIQLQISKAFDQEAYDSIVAGGENLQVLDVGSNSGDHVMDRLGDKPEVGKLIGLELFEDAVNAANQRYGSDRVHFYACDIESPIFEAQLRDIMAENQIRAFDVVNISMVLLHMKNPAKLLKVIRKHLAPGGKLLIKDIDDGLNLAYPDPDGDFERVFNLCYRLETSGFRLSGRQIPTYLLNAGFRDVQLAKIGINTLNMEYDEKQALFETYFDFILEDAGLMAAKYPTNEAINQDFLWFKECFSDLEDRFHEHSFFFNLGFVLYTARK